MTTLTNAWVDALKSFRGPGSARRSVAVNITEFDRDGLPQESPGFRERLNGALLKRALPTADKTARMIFPFSQRAVQVAASRKDLYERYERIVTLQRSYPLNKNGVYFERMVMFPGVYEAPEAERVNQLENLLSYWENNGRRRSAFQVCIYRPRGDWTKQPYAQFPCLQHVVFTPEDDKLHVSAFYATQYLIKRGYGNYLGLCRLGAFVAHEMQLKMGSVLCHAVHAPLQVTKRQLEELLDEVGVA